MDLAYFDPTKDSKRIFSELSKYGGSTKTQTIRARIDKLCCEFNDFFKRRSHLIFIIVFNFLERDAFKTPKQLSKIKWSHITHYDSPNLSYKWKLMTSLKTTCHFVLYVGNKNIFQFRKNYRKLEGQWNAKYIAFWILCPHFACSVQ